MGITARPRKRTLVRVKTFRPVAASRVEKVRIATDCHTVMRAVQSRSCQKRKAGPSWGLPRGSKPGPPRRLRTAAVIVPRLVTRRQATVTATVPAARRTYWT